MQSWNKGITDSEQVARHYFGARPKFEPDTFWTQALGGAATSLRWIWQRPLAGTDVAVRYINGTLNEALCETGLRSVSAVSNCETVLRTAFWLSHLTTRPLSFDTGPWLTDKEEEM